MTSEQTKKDCDKSPRLPKIKRPGGKKEEHSHDDGKLDKPACGFKAEILVHLNCNV